MIKVDYLSSLFLLILMIPHASKSTGSICSILLFCFQLIFIRTTILVYFQTTVYCPNDTNFKTKEALKKKKK
jgi:hypothetical protein